MTTKRYTPSAYRKQPTLKVEAAKPPEVVEDEEEILLEQVVEEVDDDEFEEEIEYVEEDVVDEEVKLSPGELQQAKVGRM